MVQVLHASSGVASKDPSAGVADSKSAVLILVGQVNVSIGPTISRAPDNAANSESFILYQSQHDDFDSVFHPFLSLVPIEVSITSLLPSLAHFLAEWLMIG